MSFPLLPPVKANRPQVLLRGLPHSFYHLHRPLVLKTLCIPDLDSAVMGSSSRSRRTHSFGGCKTCRKRHLKCDQSLPRCNRCAQAGLTCEGFTPALRWLISTGREVYDRQPTQAAEVGAEQYSRRHLFTGKSNFLIKCTYLDSGVDSFGQRLIESS
jgi:hypothetical protein